MGLPSDKLQDRRDSGLREITESREDRYLCPGYHLLRMAFNSRQLSPYEGQLSKFSEYVTSAIFLSKRSIGPRVASRYVSKINTTAGGFESLSIHGYINFRLMLSNISDRKT